MDVAVAAETLLAATKQVRVQGALAWIEEGRQLRGPHRRHEVLGALAILSKEAAYGDHGDAALRAYTKRAVVSSINPAASLVGLDKVTAPSTYREALDVLRSRCRGGTLETVDPAAISAAQKEDHHVMDALCAIVGLSFRELADRAAPASLAASTTSAWTAPQISAAFAVVDEIVRGTSDASIPGGRAVRPVELLLAPTGAAQGWAAVESMRMVGVPYEVLLTQRAVGSGWGAHRNSTQNVLPQLLRTQAIAVLTAAGHEIWHLGAGANADYLAKRIAVANDIGQVVVVAHRGTQALLAVAVAVANDGGTARRSGATLRNLPDKITIPVAVVLAGPGWAERGESTQLVVAFEGRVFTDETLAELATVSELSV